MSERHYPLPFDPSGRLNPQLLKFYKYQHALAGAMECLTPEERSALPRTPEGKLHCTFTIRETDPEWYEVRVGGVVIAIVEAAYYEDDSAFGPITGHIVPADQMPDTPEELTR